MGITQFAQCSRIIFVRLDHRRRAGKPPLTDYAFAGWVTPCIEPQQRVVLRDQVGHHFPTAATSQVLAQFG